MTANESKSDERDTNAVGAITLGISVLKWRSNKWEWVYEPEG